MSTPQRGEVWRVSLDPTEGDEMGKSRPAVVMSVNSIGILSLRVIVPLTEWKERYTRFLWMTKIEATLESGLSKASAGDAFQVRSISLSRFVKKLGQLSGEEIAEIASKIALTVGHEEE